MNNPSREALVADLRNIRAQVAAWHDSANWRATAIPAGDSRAENCEGQKSAYRQVLELIDAALSAPGEGVHPASAKGAAVGGSVPGWAESHAAVDETISGWAESLAEVDADEGRWATCTGCYESVEGYPAPGYPFSSLLGCTLGAGCGECGGLGAVWDRTDYRAMGEELSTHPAPAAAPVVDERMERDAVRWRALLSSARIRPLGCAGITNPTENHMAHLGLELWTLYPADGINASEQARGVEWLTKYADTAALQQGRDGGSSG